MSCNIARAELMYTAPGFIAANCAAPMMPSVSGVTIAWFDTTSHSASIASRSELVRRVRVVRVVRQHPHAESLEAPLGRAPDRAEADDARGLAAELPRPVALVGDLAARVDLARAHVVIGGHEPAVHGEHERDRDLGDGVGVAARGAQHGDAGLGRGRDVDVVGVAAARADAHERKVEDRALDRVGLDDEEVRALGLDAGGELLPVVEPERDLLDPGVVDDVGQGLQSLHALAAKGRGDECSRSIRHVAPWSAGCVGPSSREGDGNVRFGTRLFTQRGMDLVAATRSPRVSTRALQLHRQPRHGQRRPTESRSSTCGLL